MPSAVGTHPVPRISPLAGRPAPRLMLVDLARLEREYYECLPRAGGRVRFAVLHAHRCAGRARAEGAAGEISPEAVKESHLAGEPIVAKLTRAPGNDAPIGGLKVVAASGWFAARPSGTENIYKIYAESFKGQSHLNAILTEAEEIVNNALNSSKGRA